MANKNLEQYLEPSIRRIRGWIFEFIHFLTPSSASQTAAAALASPPSSDPPCIYVNRRDIYVTRRQKWYNRWRSRPPLLTGCRSGVGVPGGAALAGPGPRPRTRVHPAPAPPVNLLLMTFTPRVD